MQFLEKLSKMWVNVDILKLSQRKKKKILVVRTKLSYYKVFHGTFISNRNENNNINNEYMWLFRSFNTRINENINVLVLVWLCKTTI